MDNIKIWADGACSGNQFKENKGGYGAILRYQDKTKEIYGSLRNTTNNIMELTAAIKSLSALKLTNVPIEIYTDSNYVCQGMNSWIKNWERNGWKNSQKKLVENKELWIELLALSRKFNDIKFIWVKGHADNEGNIRADELCNIAISELE